MGDILPAIDYLQHNQATTAAPLSLMQHHPISRGIENRCNMLEIIDSACGGIQASCTQSPGGRTAMPPICTQSSGRAAIYSNGAGTATTSKYPAITSIGHNGSYNDIASFSHCNADADCELAARYDNVALGVGPSQNHAGLDHNFAASYLNILSGTRISHNHVRAGSNGNEYSDHTLSKPGSCWLASGGSQDLSPEEKEMIYRAAAMQPIEMSPSGGSPSRGETEAAEKPKPRRNVRISKDPQSVAARQRRQRISSKMRVLQKMVPGGMKMDTASMLEEAAQYLKFLQAEVAKMEAIEQLIIVAKGHMDCRLAQGSPLNSINSMKPKNSMPLIQSGPQAGLLCNPPSSQYPHYLNQASLTF